MNSKYTNNAMYKIGTVLVINDESLDRHIGK